MNRIILKENIYKFKDTDMQYKNKINFKVNWFNNNMTITVPKVLQKYLISKQTLIKSKIDNAVSQINKQIQWMVENDEFDSFTVKPSMFIIEYWANYKFELKYLNAPLPLTISEYNILNKTDSGREKIADKLRNEPHLHITAAFGYPNDSDNYPDEGVSHSIRINIYYRLDIIQVRVGYNHYDGDTERNDLIKVALTHGNKESYATDEYKNAIHKINDFTVNNNTGTLVISHRPEVRFYSKYDKDGNKLKDPTFIGNAYALTCFYNYFILEIDTYSKGKKRAIAQFKPCERKYFGQTIPTKTDIAVEIYFGGDTFANKLDFAGSRAEVYALPYYHGKFQWHLVRENEDNMKPNCDESASKLAGINVVSGTAGDLSAMYMGIDKNLDISKHKQLDTNGLFHVGCIYIKDLDIY